MGCQQHGRFDKIQATNTSKNLCLQGSKSEFSSVVDLHLCMPGGHVGSNQKTISRALTPHGLLTICRFDRIQVTNTWKHLCLQSSKSDFSSVVDRLLCMPACYVGSGRKTVSHALTSHGTLILGQVWSNSGNRKMNYYMIIAYMHDSQFCAAKSRSMHVAPSKPYFYICTTCSMFRWNLFHADTFAISEKSCSQT